MTAKENPEALAGGGGATSEEKRAPNSTKSDKCEGRSWRLQKPTRPVPRGQPIDFDAINRAALAAFPTVLARLLPRGKRVRAEIVALNQSRADCNLGSLKINRYNGRWADFATSDKGGGPVSLVAYLADVSQGEAVRPLARMLGIEAGGQRHG
jgi:hypothetical protein